MNRKKYSKKKKKTYILILLIILIIFIFPLAINKIPENRNDENYSTLEQELQENEAIQVETLYCTLYYPKKWQDNINIRIENEEVYTVHFFAKIKDKNEENIFDIVFGDHSNLGVLEIDGAKINVGIIFKDIVFNKTWNEEDKDTLYAMQEDINYLIGMLEKETNFVAN